MKVKDLLKWYDPETEIYYWVIQNDVDDYLEQNEIKLTLEQKKEFGYWINKYYDNYSGDDMWSLFDYAFEDFKRDQVNVGSPTIAEIKGGE